MKRFALPGIAIAAVAALLALLVYGVASKSESSSLDSAIRNGQQPVAPGATRELPAIGAPGKLRLADFRGKVVVLNFWASWCPPCVAEAPLLERTQQQLGDRGTVLGATYNDVTGDSVDFLREHHLTFPSGRDVGLKLASAYGTHGLPETFVINKGGRVVAVSRGQVSERFLRSAVREALRS